MGRLLEEIRKDYAFKLLTLLEADLREDFLKSLKRRKRDKVSRGYRDLFGGLGGLTADR